MRNTAYNVWLTALHPALGGMLTMVSCGLIFNVPADPMVPIFGVYIFLWAFIIDVMQYWGWDDKNFG